MQSEALYNQLRFNLSEPYSLNKLAVTHHRPRPIVIEKAEPGTSRSQREAHDDTGRSEAALIDQFHHLNLDKMQQAQFLAQRQLKKEKSDMLMESMNIESKKDTSPPTSPLSRPKKLVNTKSQASRQSIRTSPSRTRSKLPVSGNSPPVRDTRSRVQRAIISSTRSNRNINPAPFSSNKHQSRSTYSHSVSTAAGPTKSTTRGITRERLDETSAFSMPDLHKMAIDQLIRIQQGEYVPPATERNKPLSKGMKSVNKKPLVAGESVVSRARFLRPSVRAEAGRILREKIYRQQLHHPLPTPQKVLLSPTDQLRRQSSISQPGSYRDQSLPDPDFFIDRVMEARRQRELSERLSMNPSRVVDDIEKEARRRLEPLLQQAQRLSKNISETVTKTAQPVIHHYSPQYDTGHGLGRMSTDDLIPHRSDDHGGILEANIEPDPHASPSTSGQHREDDSSQDFSVIRDMLQRLDQMEEEHVQIRRRWMSATSQYDDPGLISLEGKTADDDVDEPQDVVMEGPKPMLMTKAQIVCPKTTTSLSHDLRGASPRGKLPTFGNDGPGEATISLPEKVTRSIESGKKRFEKHLESISHSVSKDFNPWIFAQQTADSIVDQCLQQVAEELITSGNDIIQGLYSDEFISATHSAATPIAVTAAS